MSQEYLTIKEFAEKVGKTKQAIYQQVKGRLKPYCKVEQGVTFIEISAIERFYPNTEADNSVKSNLSGSSQVEQVENSNDKTILYDILRKELEEKNRQLEVKDKQINDLNERLAEALQTLNQQQTLNAVDKKKILELEEKTASTEQQSSKGWLNWFRK